MGNPIFKLIHTADWHLGQKFLSKDREEEHKLALEWLLNTISEERADLLIVAGDIFDISNPPNYARQLYYNFLTRLRNSCCRHVILIGGNHDSPNMLNAPRELLRFLNVHVIGCATEDPTDQIIPLHSPEGELEAVVAAVPFLRDRDIRLSIAGEKAAERLERTRQGIFQHYQKMAELTAPYSKKNVPLITTGHLYAKGAKAAGDQNNIYVGDMENIRAGDFPELFDYVALGHLHRSQMVEKKHPVRYSGSLIPLSFSEIVDTKSILSVSFSKKGGKPKINEIPVPVYRPLLRVSGSFESVKGDLSRLAEELKAKAQAPAWVEIILDASVNEPQIDQQLREFVEEMPLEILKVRSLRPHAALDQLSEAEVSLDELSPLEVFRKKLESLDEESIDADLLEQTFLELQEWMKEKIYEDQ
jgi:exonuclease SbcD